jgi:RNA polymerase sigma-70 factor (ECF subfamily)
MKPPHPENLRALLLSGYRYALSLTHHRAQAEDLVQDAWVAVLQARGSQTRAYLFAAIRTRFLNQHRRERLVPMVPLDDNYDAASDDPPLPEIDSDTLERALGLLRPVERETLYLASVEGYTAEEIGALTQTSRGTVLSLLHRARHKLRRALDGEHDAEARA